MDSGRASFIFCLVASGSLFRENDAHDFSGFDVPEYFGEPEFMGLDSDDFLFCVICRIGVHLFRFRFFSGVVRRVASPPSVLATTAGIMWGGWMRSVFVSSSRLISCVRALRADARAGGETRRPVRRSLMVTTRP
jgi:hypothetical protein